MDPFVVITGLRQDERESFRWLKSSCERVHQPKFLRYSILTPQIRAEIDDDLATTLSSSSSQKIQPLLLIII